MQNQNQHLINEFEIDESNIVSFSFDAGEPLASGDSPALLFPNINDIRYSLIESTIRELGPLYVKGLYEWIENNSSDLNLQLIKLEERIELCNLSLFDDEQFKSLLKTYVLWHGAAIALYQKHSHIKGGEDLMGYDVTCKPEPELGTYKALIAQIESKQDQFGPRFHIGFNPKDKPAVKGFFPGEATRNNKMGRLITAALGEYRPFNTDELIGKEVTVTVEEVTRNGSSYRNVTKVT